MRHFKSLMENTTIDTAIAKLRDRLEVVRTTEKYHKLDIILSQIYRTIVNRTDDTDFNRELFEQLQLLLMDYKLTILEWVNERFEHSIYEGMESIDRLTDIGIEWPELNNWVNKHKSKIIKQLIQTLKHGEYQSVLADIDELRGLKVTWPELDILETPARDEQDKKDRNDTADDDDDYIDDHDLYENSVISMKIEKIIKELLLTGYVDVSIRRLEDQGLRDSEIVAALEPYAKQLVDKITSNPSMPAYTGYEIILLLQLGAKWSELIPAITKTRRAIIKHLMDEFKEWSPDDVTLDGLYADIKRLNSLGFNWPELEVLRQTIVTELKNQGIIYNDDETLTEAQTVIPPKITKQFEREYNSIHSRGVIAIWETVAHLQAIGATNQQIASLLSERREHVAQVIRNSLHNVPPTSFDTINEAMYAIYKMLSVGIKWPLLLSLLDRYKDKVTAWAVAGATDSHFGSIIADRLAAFEKLGFDTADIRQELKSKVSPDILTFLKRQGFGWHAEHKIHTLAKLNLLPITFSDQEVDDILSIFIDFVRTRGMDKKIFNSMVKLIPNESAKIKQVFEKNKFVIVKDMLKNVQHQFGHLVVDTIQILHKLNIKWPEINVITTSMKDSR